MAKARWKGRARVRRIFKALPDEARSELADVFDERAPGILGYARANTPRKTGEGRALLSTKVSRKTLRFQLGLLSARARRQGFYLNILDRGRRPQTVRATRRAPSGAISRYMIRVRAINDARFDIVFGRVRAFAMNSIGVALRDLWPRVLARYSGGGFDGD